MQTLHQVEQKCGQALFGAHAAQEQHDAMLANDLAAHDLVHMVLQGVDLTRDFLDPVKRHDADFGIFQRHRITAVVVIDDPIEPDDFASHLKAGHLITPFLGGHAGFEKAGTNRIERGKGFTVAEQGTAALDFAPHRHHIVDALHLFAGQPHRQTQFAQVAVGAGDAYRLLRVVGVEMPGCAPFGRGLCRRGLADRGCAGC